MADYCTEDDLVKIRPNIMDMGVTNYNDQITAATAVINRVLDVRWYRQAASEYGLDHREYPMDSDLFLNAGTQLTRLACYQALHLIYLFLTTDNPDPGAFERLSGMYAKLYSTELADVLAHGLDYDWDSSGALDYTEKAMPSMRRLKRV